MYFPKWRGKMPTPVLLSAVNPNLWPLQSRVITRKQGETVRGSFVDEVTTLPHTGCHALWHPTHQAVQLVSAIAAWLSISVEMPDLAERTFPMGMASDVAGSILSTLS